MNGETTLYWRALGRLYPDKRLVLRPGYLSAREPRRVERPSDELIVELLDARGVVLARHPVQLAEYCDDGEQTLRELAVRGWVPFHPATRELRFMQAGLVLLVIQRSDASPEVRLDWAPPALVSGEQRIAWTAQHREALPMQFFLRYTHTGGKRWQRVNFRTGDSALTVDFDQLPGGDRCQIAVVATDGVNTTIAESDPFAVAVKPCQPLIFSPENDQHFVVGELVSLRGQGYYLEERTVEREALQWVSSRDGELGRGLLVETLELSPGEHEITLRAGSGDRIGGDIVRIFVNARGGKASG